MADIIYITDKPVRVNDTDDTQELRLAVDVLAYDELDLVLHVLSVEGTSPSATIAIQTGMQLDSESGWNQVAAFTAATAGDTTQLKNFAQFARYVKWDVSAFSGSASPAVTFTLQGVARRWA